MASSVAPSTRLQLGRSPAAHRRFSTASRDICAHLVAKKAEQTNAVWTQDEEIVTVGVQIEDEVRARDVALEVHPKRMVLDVQGERVLEGTFPTDVDPDGSYFTIEEKDGHRLCVLTIEKKGNKMENGFTWSAFFADEQPDTSITDWAFLDVAIGTEGEEGYVAPQRLEVGLYGTQAPKTVQNFLALCSGEAGKGEAGVPLHYKGSKFHRIIKNFMAQGGDFTNGDGSGGESIYGRTFDDETLSVRHDARGKLCMANAGPNTNGSQFYITFVPCPHLDGNHVVFGELTRGSDHLKAIEDAGSEGGEPAKPVTIVDCGTLSEAGGSPI